MRLSAALGALLILPGWLPAQEKKVKDSPYYPLKPGTRWVYRAGEQTYTTRVVKHEPIDDAVCARVETTGGGQTRVEHLAVKAEGVYRYQADGKKITPPLLILKLPPKAGQSWKVDSSADGVALQGSFVLGEAEVAVPAGKYKALVVTSKDYTVGGRPTDLRCWYAEGVGMVKQQLMIAGVEIVLELESFTAGA